MAVRLERGSSARCRLWLRCPHWSESEAAIFRAVPRAGMYVQTCPRCMVPW